LSNSSPIFVSLWSGKWIDRLICRFQSGAQFLPAEEQRGQEDPKSERACHPSPWESPTHPTYRVNVLPFLFLFAVSIFTQSFGQREWLFPSFSVNL